MVETFDVVVIGSGPGGYRAATRCAQKGMTVAIIEKGEIGGVCLNRGCIPSKALLASAGVLLQAKKAGAMGVDIPTVSPNWAKIQERKDAIVTSLRKGMAGPLQTKKIKMFTGVATATSPKTVLVEPSGAELNANGSTLLTAGKGIIIATGSVPAEIPALAFDNQTIISSTDALCLQKIPRSMVVVGGGIIGCELACMYAALGTKVTIVEALERIINIEDKWVGRLLGRELKKLGIDIITGRKVTSVDAEKGIAKVVVDDGKIIEAEKVLVAVGRKATCDKQTIDNLKLQTSGSAIKVDDRMQTNVPGVYAVGDVVGATYLAHGAFAEAEVAAENISDGNTKMADYSLIPRVVYTFPEIASVGKTEDRCTKEGIDIAVGKGFFKANGRSVAHNETTGEIRVVRDKGTDKILGVTMVGANVTELISAARLLTGSTERFNTVSFPHPTVSEVLKDAWEAALSR